MCNFTDQIIFFIFSFKFHFLPIPEHCRLCLCGGLLHSSDAPSHPLGEPGAPDCPRGRAKSPAAACCLSGHVAHTKHPELVPTATTFPLAGRASLQHTVHSHSIPPVPELVLSTHTQRKMRLGLLHTLCDRATATGTLPTTWDLSSCIFFRHLHACVRMGQERCPLQGSPR